MNFSQRKFVVPKEVFLSESIEEALSRLQVYVEQARDFGMSPLYLPYLDPRSPLFPRINDEILTQGLSPVHGLSLPEFAEHFLALKGWLEKGVKIVVHIHRDFTASELQRMEESRPLLNQLSFVVVGRRDWRFKDCLRSLPSSIRSRLYLDFPVSLSDADPFYKPNEVSSLIAEIERNMGIGRLGAHFPNWGIQRDMPRSSVRSASAPVVIAGDSPRLSIVATSPELLDQLEKMPILKRLAGQLEILVPRLAGQKTKVLRRLNGIQVSRLWLHAEEGAEDLPGAKAHLLNFGAQHARGEVILFSDLLPLNDLAGTLQRFFFEEVPAQTLLRANEGFWVDKEQFKALGGFDPLYFSFGWGELEFLYRFMRRLDLTSTRVRSLVSEIAAAQSAPLQMLGLKFFYHQHLDYGFYQAFANELSSSSMSSEREILGQQLREEVKYKLQQSKDAYVNLYRATPKVAIQGNLQILFQRPYDFLRRRLWRLKMPLYPLYSLGCEIYGRLKFCFFGLLWILGHAWAIAIQPFHWVKMRLWWAKVPAYAAYHFAAEVASRAWMLKFVIYGAQWAFGHLRGLGSKAFWALRAAMAMPAHFARLHVWRVKYLFYLLLDGYHWLRLNLWRVKFVYHAMKQNTWRVKQIYHLFFWLMFPVRKVYYFCEFQFEKRVLGLGLGAEGK